MTIILPRPPSPDPNDEQISLELQILRDQTEWFINANPSRLILTPTNKTKDGQGGFTRINLSPRPLQTLRVIAMSDSQKPTLTDDGVEREIDLTLLGPWDAQIDIGDWWRDGENLYYSVIELIPYNGYEVRALVIKQGHA
jgi:hypothetical protein